MIVGDGQRQSGRIRPTNPTIEMQQSHKASETVSA